MTRWQAHRTIAARIRRVILVLAACSPCVDAAVPGADPHSFTHRLAVRLSERLTLIEERLAHIDREMRGLPVLPDMDALGSHGFHSNFTEDSESNWFRIAWKQPRRIEGIALVPTRQTTQSGDMSNYGFPRSLRIEAGIPGHQAPVVIAELHDSHLDFRRGEPVHLPLAPTVVEWLRVIPTDLPTFPGKSVRFFSVSEFLVFDGDRNIAPDGDLSAGFSIDGEAGWNLRYLVDGQSPLGPPELPLPAQSLGWHTDMVQSPDSVAWAVVDLGGTAAVDGVRIIAAKGDSPVKGPGFGFPVEFRIDTSTRARGDDWTTVWSSGPDPFQNPGYNPVLIRFPKVDARRVRLFIVTQHQPDKLTAPRVLLSEFEVLQGNTNLALLKPVTSSDQQKSRPHDAKRVWSAAGLTDGHSSTGRLMPLRRWVEELSRCFDLALEQRALVIERERILSRTHVLALAAAFTLLGGMIVALMIWQIRLRMSARRHIGLLRRKISSDLHDEVGSNLATISLLAEISPATGDPPPLADISRLARESSLSLREIIDLTLVPKRARKPLPERLREIAGLMLKDHDWRLQGEDSPDLDPEQRRNLVFFFKEALHNIFRHAAATRVEMKLAATHGMLELSIHDNGRGLPPRTPADTPRLRTLEQRAESLHGRLDIESCPGSGTHLTLRFPLKQHPRR
jgi:signal transduction histidine kinase